MPLNFIIILFHYYTHVTRKSWKSLTMLVKNSVDTSNYKLIYVMFLDIIIHLCILFIYLFIYLFKFTYLFIAGGFTWKMVLSEMATVYEKYVCLSLKTQHIYMWLRQIFWITSVKEIKFYSKKEVRKILSFWSLFLCTGKLVLYSCIVDGEFTNIAYITIFIIKHVSHGLNHSV